MRFRGVNVVLLLVAASLAPRAVAAPAAAGAEAALPGDDVSRLIQRLAHPDPLERDKAGDQLVQLGAPARDAVLRATESDDPELASGAASVLARLPWWVESDPPAVRQLLIQYGASSPATAARAAGREIEGLGDQLAQLGDGDAAAADERRRRIAEALAARRAAIAARVEATQDPRHVRSTIIQQLKQLGAHLVLLRLLMEEPDEATRWDLAVALAIEMSPERPRRPQRLVAPLVPNADRDRLAMAEVVARLKTLPPDAKNTAALVLAARAWMPTEREKALAMLRLAVERTSSDAAWQRGIGEAYNELLEAAMARRDYADAAALLRRLAMSGYPRISTWRPPSLFALHAYVGPLPGYSIDVVALGPSVGRPNFFDRIAFLYGAGGGTIPSLLAYAAHARANANVGARFSAGQFLLQHRLYAAAGSELQAAVTGGRPAAQPNPAAVDEVEDEDGEVVIASSRALETYAFNAHRLLAIVAVEQRGDDRAAAEHLRQAIECRKRLVAAIPGNVAGNDDDEEDLAAEMHWRLLRAARTAKDEPALRKELDELRRLPHGNADITHDVAALLRERGEGDAAAAVFEETYKSLRATLDEAPDSAPAMNNLAWLCARSGERVPEALELATRAVALDPHNAAYLDTAAEANFRAGKIDEAIRLETYGLELRPGDKFMTEQLERFKAAKTK